MKTLLRNSLLQTTLIASMAIAMSSQTALANLSLPLKGDKNVKLTQKWDKTFPQSSLVEHQKVTFKNRFGITLVADVYVPKKRSSGKLQAIAISGPFGAVKEQSSGVYAQELAERGFLTIAFDPSYTGESSGEPRNIASPDINTEDVMAAVDYLGLLDLVDRNKIGLLGVCGWGGLNLSAAAVDKRIKAVATTVMYDMSRILSQGFNDSYTPEQRTKLLENLSYQRWVDAENGKPAYGSHAPSFDKAGNVVRDVRTLPEVLPENAHPITAEFFDYYRTKRGFHQRSPNSAGAWSVTTPISFMNFPQLTYIKEISPRPVLIVTGEVAHSRYFAETAYKEASEPKELVIVPGANHVDLYDKQSGKIPFDKLEAFFKSNLK
ncbi:alpha/beta hydrolase [Methylophilus sp. QUAN]|uniref:alpha/beta hydrolase n=1 Tax=Methylophilus sp. QUAN TaxID=2781020 RepID=UPI00188E9812|nr:alpha/beta hydrolase [Methylophilus sp. QUAN]MBF4991984.1 alpha/beta hydrolase [Methylophilus sp. QUAN]